MPDKAEAELQRIVQIKEVKGGAMQLGPALQTAMNRINDPQDLEDALMAVRYESMQDKIVFALKNNLDRSIYAHFD